MAFQIITNNPFVQKKKELRAYVRYVDGTYKDVLTTVRDLVQQGYPLLSHPLSGSVKPNETPYKSVLVGTKRQSLDTWGEEIIEQSITACEKFPDLRRHWSDRVLSDFQYIDYTLLESAVQGATAR